MLAHTYIESRKIALMNLFARKEWRLRCREWICGHRREGRDWDRWRKVATGVRCIAGEGLLCSTGSPV